MRNLVPALGLAALALWSAGARAECQQKYTGEQLVSDLQTVNLALRNLDETAFATSAKRLEGGIVCLGSQAPPPIFASAYRYVGTYHFMVLNDEAGARKWFRTALEIDPTHTWDATELELSHPMREVYEQERLVAPTNMAAIEGKEVNLPAGSTLAIDGRPLVEAAAALDRPHIVQQIASDRSVRGTWLVEGNAIPAQFLRDPVVAAAPEEEAPKKEKKPKKTKGTVGATTQPSEGLQVMQIERVRPPEKTPLLIAGALGLVGAGGVYWASTFSRAEFDGASTTEELERTRTVTNAMVLASGGVLLAGAGVAYWGIILDGGAGVGVGVQF